MDKIQKWLSANTTSARLSRTIFQAVIGVLIANVDFLVSYFQFSAEMKAFIVAIVMAVLSPIMAELGGRMSTPDMVVDDLGGDA